MSNLAAGFTGSFLTVLPIDNALARERDRQTVRVRKLALGQIRPWVVQQLDLVGTWRKVSVAARPNPLPRDLRQLFDDAFYRDVQRCDFSRESGTLPPSSWYARSFGTLDQCQKAIETTIDLEYPLSAHRRFEFERPLRRPSC